MSSTIRIIIGLIATVGAIGFLYVASPLGGQLPVGPWPFVGMAVFWALVAIACFSEKCRPLALRFIGATVFLVYAAYAFSSYGDETFSKALAGFVCIGLPAGYLAFTGKPPQL